MEFQLEHRPGDTDGRLRASGDMNIYSANAMKQQLLAHMQGAATMDKTGELLLDLSEVVEIDTCGLQILLLAERMATASGRTFRIVDPSAAASEVLALCGLAHFSRTGPRTGASSGRAA
jgi:anti-anti-sigma factor